LNRASWIVGVRVNLFIYLFFDSLIQLQSGQQAGRGGDFEPRQKYNSTSPVSLLYDKIRLGEIRWIAIVAGGQRVWLLHLTVLAGSMD